MKRHSDFYTLAVLAIISGVLASGSAIWMIVNMVILCQEYPHISSALQNFFWISVGLTVFFTTIAVLLAKKSNQYNKRWFNSSEFLSEKRHK